MPLREYSREYLRQRLRITSRKLEFYFRRATPATIEQLPVDVLRYILNTIPPTEAAALALSSKVMLNAAGPEILRIERIEDRAELLKHFERFYPNHLLCYQCGKFHLRRTKEVYEHEGGDTECDKKNGRFSFSSYILDIPFTTVQEIMNRHRYGKRHGISVKCLNRCGGKGFNPFDHR